MNDYDFLVSDISSIKGIGTKTTKLFKKKNINTVFDLLWSLPRDYTDRTQISKINELQLGKVQTLVVNVEKYSFPRIRNLPNKIICEDEISEKVYPKVETQKSPAQKYKMQERNEVENLSKNDEILRKPPCIEAINALIS